MKIFIALFLTLNAVPVLADLPVQDLTLGPLEDVTKSEKPAKQKRGENAKAKAKETGEKIKNLGKNLVQKGKEGVEKGRTKLNTALDEVNGKLSANDTKKETTPPAKASGDDAKNHADEKVSSNNDNFNPAGNDAGGTNSNFEELAADEDTETKKLKEKKEAYEDAKATEQSKENRMLTAATTAATGIGGMELAMGLAEQKADKAAEQNMDAYIATFRCTYGNGKQVRGGKEEIELPGGNDATMMKYREEYFALAESLKVRKTALDMTPGIEAEEIMDKSQMGLYDDENLGITDGAYASLYRAKMLGSEKDQQEIDEAKKKSKNRVIGGAVVAGAGVVGGAIGDSLINGKLSEKIKEAKEKKNADKEEDDEDDDEDDVPLAYKKCDARIDNYVCDAENLKTGIYYGNMTDAVYTTHKDKETAQKWCNKLDDMYGTNGSCNS